RQIGLEVFEFLCLSILAEIDAYRGETEKARRVIPGLLHALEAGRFRWGAFRLRIASALLDLACDDPGASWQAVAELFEDVEEPDGYGAQRVVTRLSARSCSAPAGSSSRRGATAKGHWPRSRPRPFRPSRHRARIR